jgi:hypothetical protein
MDTVPKRLYERLGWTGPDRDMKRTLANSLEFVESRDNAPNRPDLIPYNKSDVAIYRCNVAMAYYLLGDHVQANCFARDALERGVEYFFGSWRSELQTREGTIDPNWWKANLSWAHIFRELVLWGEYVSDQTTLAKLAQFPDPECSMSDSDYSRADFAFFFALAAALRGDGDAGCMRELDRAVTGKKKKTVVAAVALSHIVNQAPLHFQGALDDLVAVHHKRRSNRDFTELVSVDGSNLYHMACDRGFSPDIRDEFRDYIVERPPHRP